MVAPTSKTSRNEAVGAVAHRVALFCLVFVIFSAALQTTDAVLNSQDIFSSWGTRRERKLRDDQQTLQVGMASLIDPGSRIQVCKVDVTKRASCGDFLGNTLPCPVSPGYRGVVNYTVAQGDSLTVNFNTNSSTTVIMGGSPNGGFAEDAPCQVTGLIGAAPSQPIASNSLTGFTFAPTRAVCPSFVNNTQGQMSVYVFDTSNGSVNITTGDYSASACRFTVNLFIQKAADAPINDSQFYYGASQSLG